MRPLAVIGNVNVDLIMGPTTPWPTAGTEVMVDHDELRPGGAAGNVALAWAGLDVPFVIASNVGGDAFGGWLSDALDPQSQGWTTSTCATTISVGLIHPGDERTFFTTRGHLADLHWADVLPQLNDMQGGLVLLCGCFLMDGLTRDYPALFAWATALGVEIALDSGWPPGGWTAAQQARVRGWLKHCHHLLVNEIEAHALSGKDTLDTALPALAAMMPPDATVVIKTGGRGAMGLRGAIKAEASAPEVVVIDTIGAGDIFDAGYLLAVAEGAGLSQALVSAVTLASRAISTTPRLYERAQLTQGLS